LRLNGSVKTDSSWSFWHRRFCEGQGCSSAWYSPAWYSRWTQAVVIWKALRLEFPSSVRRRNRSTGTRNREICCPDYNRRREKKQQQS